MHETKYAHADRFCSSLVDRILRSEACVGRYWYNRKSRDGAERPRSEWIAVKLSPIITEATFRRAHVLMRQSGPTITAPRIVNSPVVLGGLAVCGSCGSNLTICTGTSKSGARFRYYRCARRVLDKSCDTPASVREDELDKVVIEALCAYILTPVRIREVVATIAVRRAEGRDDAVQSLTRLRA